MNNNMTLQQYQTVSSTDDDDDNRNYIINNDNDNNHHHQDPEKQQYSSSNSNIMYHRTDKENSKYFGCSSHRVCSYYRTMFGALIILTLTVILFDKVDHTQKRNFKSTKNDSKQKKKPSLIAFTIHDDDDKISTSSQHVQHHNNVANTGDDHKFNVADDDSNNETIHVGSTVTSMKPETTALEFTLAWSGKQKQQQQQPASTGSDGITNKPGVAWLMSFPNSGTSYTISNVERMSNRSTASNYAADFTSVVSVVSGDTNGPFVHKPNELALPSKFILTKTHCAGYCDNCPPRNYMITQEQFEQGCVRAEMPGTDPGERTEVVQYNIHLVQRAVHLFRSPFDNIVARMHLAMKKQQRAKTQVHESSEWLQSDIDRYSSTNAGFAAWCEHIDNSFVATEEDLAVSDEVLELFRDLPCHAEWFRYTMWHNHAYTLTESHSIPVHYLYYEDYGESTAMHNTTVSNLMEFLQFDDATHHQPLPFISSGKTYKSFYDALDIQRATKLVQTIALPEVWELVQRYF